MATVTVQRPVQSVTLVLSEEEASALLTTVDTMSRTPYDVRQKNATVYRVIRGLSDAGIIKTGRE